MKASRVAAAATVVHEAVAAGRMPTGIAAALEAEGRLVGAHQAEELDRLEALMNAEPAELTPEQVDALAAAGNLAVNDANHADQCMCDDWPEKCKHYSAGFWDTGALDTAMPAVIALWEVMRNDRHAAKVAELRARVAELEAAQAAIRQLHLDSVAGPCPTCFDGDGHTAGGDGLVPYPCPTARLAGATDVVPTGRPLRPDPLASGPIEDKVDTWFGLLDAAAGITATEDPRHPCGCPKRFDRHADGCPGGTS